MKLRVMVFGCLLLLLLCGCDRYADKRPARVSHEKWVSEDPDLYFIGWDEETDCRYGQLKVKDEATEIFVYFDYCGWIHVAEYISYKYSYTYEDDLLAGQCKFGKNKLKVTILPEDDKLNLFGGEKKVITFIKETIPDENVEPVEEEKTGKEKLDTLLEHIHNFWIDASLSL